MKNLRIAVFAVMVSLICCEITGKAAEPGRKFSENLDLPGCDGQCGQGYDEITTTTTKGRFSFLG